MRGVYSINGAELIELDIVTPEMYGAKGDGTTNDYTAFQNMFAGGNKQIVLEPKQYLINGHINVYSNTIIHGNGAWIDARQSPFIIGESGDYAYAYDGTKNVEFRNLRISVNNYATNHIIMAHAQDIRIIDCELFNNNEHSIELNSSKNVLVENCVFRNVAPSTTNKEAINIDPAHTGHTLNMGYFDDTISDYVKIIGCLFENCWCPVGNHGETPYASRNIIFKNNDVRNCYRGAQLHSYGNIFIENNFFDVQEKGVRLIAAQDVVMTGNRFNSTDSVISVESTTKNVFIKDNIMDTEATTPITVASSASGIHTSDNIINNVLT